jgi:hypothetical protein
MTENKCTLNIRTLPDTGEINLCWFNEYGKKVSPIFHSKSCAEMYPKRMPMLTDEEWETEITRNGTH